MKKINLANIPEMIQSSIIMEEPNQTIPVFTGTFNVKREGKSMLIDGKITFEWFPTKQIIFNGNLLESEFSLDEIVKLEHKYELIIDGLSVGDCHFSEITFGKNSEVHGVINHHAIIGDKSVPVSKIVFSIPNLREFFGHPIKISENGISKARLSFATEKYLINIDQKKNIKN